MKIIIPFACLKITVEAEGVESCCDAYMIAAAALAQTQKLGYGKPKIQIDLDDEPCLKKKHT